MSLWRRRPVPDGCPPRPGAPAKAWHGYFEALTDAALLALGEDGIERLKAQDAAVRTARAAQAGQLCFGNSAFLRVKARLHHLIWAARYERARQFLDSASDSALNELSINEARELISSCASPPHGQPPLTLRLHRRRCQARRTQERALLVAVAQESRKQLARAVATAERSHEDELRELRSRFLPGRERARQRLREIDRAIEVARASGLAAEVVSAEIHNLELRRHGAADELQALDHTVARLQGAHGDATRRLTAEAEERLSQQQRSLEREIDRTAATVAGYCPYNIGRELHRHLFPDDAHEERRRRYEDAFQPVVTQLVEALEELQKNIRKKWFEEEGPTP